MDKTTKNSYLAYEVKILKKNMHHHQIYFRATSIVSIIVITIHIPYRITHQITKVCFSQKEARIIRINQLPGNVEPLKRNILNSH